MFCKALYQYGFIIIIIIIIINTKSYQDNQVISFYWWWQFVYWLILDNLIWSVSKAEAAIGNFMVAPPFFTTYNALYEINYRLPNVT